VCVCVCVCAVGVGWGVTRWYCEHESTHSSHRLCLTLLHSTHYYDARVAQVLGSIGKLLADNGTTPPGGGGSGGDASDSPQAYRPSGSKQDDDNGAADRAAAFWRDLLGTILPSLLADELPLVRVAACDCSSMIGERPYMALPLEVQYHCQSTLLGLTRDPVTSVRAAASRAVGVLVLYKGPRDDDLYVMDVANALLETSSDGSLPTRVRASWALGNLCDALVLKQRTQDGYDIPIALIKRLVDAALLAARDTDKVRPNAMRALGGLSRSFTSEFVATDEGHDVAVSIVRALCANLATGPVKNRWNAAHAFGTLLSNPNIPLGEDADTADAARQLLDVIRTSSNFKVSGIALVHELSSPFVSLAGIIHRL
jgi:hypothetical protein